MHHRIRDLNPGRKAINQNSPSLPLQNRKQSLSQSEVLIRKMKRSRKLPFKRFRHRDHLRLILAGDQQRSRSKNLFAQAQPKPETHRQK